MELFHRITLEEIYQIIAQKYDVEVLSQYLIRETNFMYAPASSSKKLHGCYPGGLLDHTLNVVTLAKSLYDSLLNVSDVSQNIDVSDLVLAAFLHDLGKAHKGYYIPSREAEEPYKKGEISKIPHDHLSVFMVSNIRLDIDFEVLEAILIHNGLFTGTGKDVMKKHNHSLLAWIIHSADMMALKFEK